MSGWSLLWRAAALIMLVLDRFPVLVWLGAMLLGWIAGGVIASDHAVQPLLHRLLDGQIVLNIDATSAIFGVSSHFSVDEDLIETIAALLGAVIVLIAGSTWRRRALRQVKHDAHPAAVGTPPS